MTLTELAQSVPAVLATVRAVLAEAIVLKDMLARIALHPQRGAGYENLSLDLSLEIKDRQGNEAILERRQRVRFLRAGDRVIRDLIWGEGRPLARYTVTGAERLSIVPEGSRRALLLDVSYPPRPPAATTIRSRRLIVNGLLGQTEYCEAFVERPTDRLAMRVTFPADRPPKAAHLATVPASQPARRIPLRVGLDGRPYLSWRATRPRPHTLYSLRWSW